MLIERRRHNSGKHAEPEVGMYHPETAYQFGKEHQLKLERFALEGSPVFARLARLVRRRVGTRGSPA
ncbi:MAG: hypothetical protein M3188_06380 [Actinomycetota bacterium]|nr:hypothetical protein [Actinomycetota bacterium]